MSRETIYGADIKDGDRIEVVATVDKVELDGATVTVHFSGTETRQAAERVWKHAPSSRLPSI